MPYGANNVPVLECEQRHITGGSALDSMLVVDTDTATLAWLVSALEQARTQGQSKALGYLEAVADDVVFEMESAARRSQFKGADHRLL
jgi:hypothetical protein